MKWRTLLNFALIISILQSACGLFAMPGATPPAVEVNLPPLPAPSPMPAGTIEEAAFILAGSVRQEGDTGLAALETALAAAGFPVQNEQGQLLQLTGYDDAGIVIPDWQVRAIALTAQSNALIRLTDLANILCGMDGWAGKEALVAEALLVGIRDGLGSDVPASTRFFSAFIIELGKQQPESADWLTETDPNNIWIDGLQVQLIMRRLANEIAFSAPANPETPTPAVDLEMPGPLQLAWSLPISAMRQNAPAHSLCTLSPEESSYIGAAEDSIQKLFEILIKDIAKTGERYFTFASWFNAAITWANLMAVWATIRIDAQMEGGTPLKRTHDQRPGELRNITVTVSHITSDAQLINCFGLAFASIGLSMVKLPNGGPVEGAGTEWVGLDGFVGRGTDLSKWIVQFNAKGKNPTNIKTDAEGQAEMYVEGFGQETEISEGTPPVDKSFTILVTVRLKDADFWQDLIDAAKTVQEAGQEGPGIGAIVKFMVEMLQRTTLIAPSLKKTFPVIDWVNGYTADMFIYAEARITQVSENLPAGFLHVGDVYNIAVDLHGQKCGGVGGKWILEVIGDPQTKGYITVQIDANTLRGNWQGNITEVYTGVGPQGTTTWTLGGTAQFFKDNPPGLELKVEKIIFQVTKTYEGMWHEVYNGSATGEQKDATESYWVDIVPVPDGTCK